MTTDFEEYSPSGQKMRKRPFHECVDDDYI